MSAPWRNDIEKERKKTIGEIEKKVAIIDANGNIVDYNWDKLKNYSYEEILWMLNNVEGATIEGLGIDIRKVKR